MISNNWQLQDAKNKFSSLVEKARRFGPQIVTKHGEEVVVVLDVSEYKKLIKPKNNLVDFFKKSPLANIELNLDRNKELSRKIEL